MRIKKAIVSATFALLSACSDDDGDRGQDSREVGEVAGDAGGRTVGDASPRGKSPDAGRDAGSALTFSATVLTPQGDKLLALGPGITNTALDRSLPATNGRDMVLCRYDASGKLDKTFGTNGVSVVDFKADPLHTEQFTGDRPYGLSFTPDGKILVAGYGSSNSLGIGQAAALARLSADGVLDTTFGHGGVLLYLPNDADDRTDSYVFRIARSDAAGRIYAAGDSTYDDSWLVRFAADGKLDPDFNGGAPVSISRGLGNAIDLFVSEARVVWVGRGFRVAAFALDGAVDTTFGDKGVAEIGRGQSYQVQQLEDGSFFLAGDGSPDYDNGKVLKLAMLSAAGKPASYGTAGVVEVALKDWGIVDLRGMHVERDHSVLLYNHGVSAYSLARFTASGAVDSSFGMAGRQTLDFKVPVLDFTQDRESLLAVLEGQVWIASNASPTPPLYHVQP